MAIMRCRESFCYWDANGVPHDVPAGTLIDTDKVTFFEGRESLFETVEVYVDQQHKPRTYTPPKTEAATAAPGEKREFKNPNRSGD